MCYVNIDIRERSIRISLYLLTSSHCLNWFKTAIFAFCGRFNTRPYVYTKKTVDGPRTRLFDEIIGQETVTDDAEPVPVPVALNFVVTALFPYTAVTVHQTPAVVHLDGLKPVLLDILVELHRILLILSAA